MSDEAIKEFVATLPYIVDLDPPLEAQAKTPMLQMICGIKCEGGS